jgi:hypothetical protein
MHPTLSHLHGSPAPVRLDQPNRAGAGVHAADIPRGEVADRAEGTDDLGGEGS